MSSDLHAADVIDLVDRRLAVIAREHARAASCLERIESKLSEIEQHLGRLADQHDQRSSRKYDPDLPAPIYTGRARRIVAHLEGLPAGSRIATTRELADQLDIPAKSFQNSYFIRRVEAAGAARCKLRGLNYWYLVRDGRPS